MRWRRDTESLLSVCEDRFQHSLIPNSGAYVFHDRGGFGIAYPSLREAYEDMSVVGGWLIVTADGKVGIHRPEERFDTEIVFKH